MQTQIATSTNTTKPVQGQDKPSPAPYLATPPVDVYESAEEIRVFVDLPGVASDAVTLDVEGETVALTARRTFDGQKRPVVYKRRFFIPREIALENIAAKLEDGVLALTLPKRSVNKPRSIKITTA